MHTFGVRTHTQTEITDVTAEVQKAVSVSGVEDGICLIVVPHTTAGVTINENADPAVKADVLKELNKIVPFDDAYTHLEGNSAAHLKASLMGNSATVPIENGRLVLGTWQGIWFCEFDGPRSRQVWVKCK
jgi:secondary thiamine-phosphate synthase enzyme